MSPKGLKAPPALAAQTTLTMPIATNRRLSAPTAITTAPMTSAVVRLSATADRKNAMVPVTQKTCR